MKIKVSSGFSGVIPTGSYQNARPSYTAEIEVDVADEAPMHKMVDEMQKRLQEISFKNFKEDEQRHLVERIQRERADMRFYATEHGQYPSVTSIIGWDADFMVPPHELSQYASQGNLYDAQVRHYINTNEWKHPKDIEGTWTDIVIVKKGNLELTINKWDFPKFLEKFPLEKMEEGKPVFSHEHRFAGTPDVRVCWHNGKKTMADVKRTPDPAKHFKQVAAYILAEEESGEEPYAQMMLIPANDKTKQGFSKPVISTEIKQYQEMFLKDREAFKKRFGI